jgi:hypothetical protein
VTEVRTTVTQYTVNAYPNPDSINARHYSITVEHRGGDRWAVCHMGAFLSAGGRWSWRDAHHHDHDTALCLAQRAASRVLVNGRTAAQCWKWEQSVRAEAEAVTHG